MTNKETKEEYLTMPVAVIIAGALIGLGAYLGGAASKTPTDLAAQANGNNAQAGQQVVEQTSENIDPVTSADHIRGSSKAKVFLIEYSDPECPFCKRFHPTLKNVMDKYISGNEVAWVYRNFPIDSLHSKARKEAEATECAADIGGNDSFWKFYDRLFEVSPTNNGLDPAQLPVIAKDIGLDVEKFNTCLSSGKFAAKVEAGVQSGTKAGVRGTPTTFIVSGKSAKTIVGAVPESQIETEIQNMLKK